MSPSVEVCEIPLCRAYIQMPQPAAHMLYRRRWTPIRLIPFQQGYRSAVAQRMWRDAAGVA